jgi:hypothetical protein
LASLGTQSYTIEDRGWLRDPGIRLCENPINLGKGRRRPARALRRHRRHPAGAGRASRTDPREYGKLLAPILEGRTNVVYGSRFLQPSNGISRRSRIANIFLTTLTNVLFGGRLTDMETAYKVFRRSTSC